MKKIVMACGVVGLAAGSTWLIAGEVGTLNTFKAGDPISSSQVNDNFSALQNAVNDNNQRVTVAEGKLTQMGTDVAALQAQAGSAGACPDDMVAVGSICVDKYEASLTADAAGTTPADATLCGANGNDCSKNTATAIYAQSKAGVAAAVGLTWFQAAQACANSGKRLLTNAEWQVAAAGTPDDASCNVSGSAQLTGSSPQCVSNWGVSDMVGGVWEWVADWTSGSTAPFAPVSAGNSDVYGGDAMTGVNPAAERGKNEVFPAAVIRGGYYGSAAGRAGIFAYNAVYAPSVSDTAIGFRCAM